MAEGVRPDFLAGRVVIVSGATGTLGRVVVKRLLESGAAVAAIYRDAKKYRELVDFVGGETPALEGLRADVTLEEEVGRAVESVVRNRGRVDVLLNLAGAYRGGAEILGTAEDDWEFLMNTNLKSAFLCAKAVLPAMIKANYGRIVSVGARQAVEKKNRAKSGAYTVSKAGVVLLTEILAEETKKFDITVNCVLPGTIDSPENRKSIPGGDFSKWAKPEDIAAVLLFLISNEASVTSGAAIPVYGKS